MSDVPSEKQPDQEAGQPDAADGGPTLDAASAAGFGGITWADDALDDDAGTGNGAGAAGPASDQPAGDAAGDAATGDGVIAGEQQPSSEPAGTPPDTGTASGPEAAGAGAGDGATSELSVEGLVEDLERVTKERDQYLDASRRLQADFENYRKAVAKREIDSRQRANESLVAALLPVLDACDGALSSGATDVEPIRTMLMDVLGKQGLDRIDDTGKPFDPALHDAVMHEPAPDGDGPVVAEVMRAGYSWKGRVVRPAMVRVRG